MKKLSALFFCVLFIFTAAGCKSEKSEFSHNIDIAYFGNMGAFPECDYKIGDSLPDADTLGKAGFMTFLDQSPAFVTDGEFYFYYDSSSENPVFLRIVSLDKCLGFEAGSISIEITDVLDSQDIGYTEREPDEDELSFLPAGENRTVIECKSLKYKLFFVLEDNALCATVLQEPTYAANSN